MKRILTICDNKDNLEILSSFLSGVFPKFKIIASLSGIEGMAKAGKQKPDMIIVDYMSGKDGYDTFKNLKEEDFFKDTPVVMITSDGIDTDIRIQELKSNMDVILTKPVDEPKLMAQINSIIDFEKSEEQAHNKFIQLNQYLSEWKKAMDDSKRTAISLLEDLQTEIENHKLSKEALLQSEKEFHNLYNDAPVGLYRTTLDGEILLANHALFEMLGFPRGAEFSVKDLEESGFEPTYRREQFMKQIRKCGEVKDLESKWICCNGEVIIVQENAKVICNSEGIPLYYNGTVEDITERKKSEEELKLFRSLIEQINDSIEIIDPKTGRFLDSNKKAFLELGYSREEFLSLKVSDIDPIVDKPIFQMIVEELQKSGFAVFESQHRRKDGSTFPVEVNVKYVNLSKDYVVSVVRDITERKKAEQELIMAKEKAEESDRLKSAFLAKISHEIRTPMNGILGFADLLRDPMLTRDQQCEFMKIIEKSSKRMLDIITDIINIAKIVSEPIEVVISEVSVNEQMNSIYSCFGPMADQKGIQFFCKNPLSVKGPVLKTDKEKINTILTNLIKNAIKYTSKGVIEFGYEKKDKFIEFFVKDTGIGIREDQRKIIFERFRQGTESYNRNYDGAGLGLSIAKAYVETLGGEIWVESKPEVGSVFYFTLPYNIEREEEITSINEIIKENKDNTENIADIPRNLKILIAEDDLASEMFIKIALGPFAREILIAKTGIEAVEACRNNPDIDLILMDIRMPKLNGYEATQQIRQFNYDVIIIAQTAFALAGDRELAIKAGCNDYISKPINKAILFELIKKHIN